MHFFPPPDFGFLEIPKYVAITNIM